MWRATTTRCGHGRAPPAALGLRGEHHWSTSCLCSSSSPLAAAHRVRSAGSTLVRELKEHRTFDCEELFSSGLQRETASSAGCFPCKERTDGIAPCAKRRVPSRPPSYVHINAGTPRLGGLIPFGTSKSIAIRYMIHHCGDRCVDVRTGSRQDAGPNEWARARPARGRVNSETDMGRREASTTRVDAPRSHGRR